MKTNKKRKPQSFTAFALQALATLETQERFSTAHVYRYAFNAFICFKGGGEVFLGAINRQTLKQFEEYLRMQGRKWNTISTYLRALRTLYNQAVITGKTHGEYRLFSEVFTGRKIDEKRALSAEEMHRLLTDNATVLDHMPQALRQSRDLLALMFRLQGMPFVDLMHLYRTDLTTDATGRPLLQCHRKKTRTQLKVVVCPEAMKLIDRYRSTDPKSPYLFHFFDGIQSNRALYHAYGSLLRNLNAGLRKLADYLGLQNIKVSTYTARHSWATLAKYCGVSEEVISEGLGHTSLDTTRTYLKRFNNNTLAKANTQVMAQVFG